jgi:NAD kinase
MQFKNILCVSKITPYEWYSRSAELFEDFRKLKPSRQERLRERHFSHQGFFSTLQAIVDELALPVTYIGEDQVDTVNAADYDLIISCGGDGTFLTIAQHFTDTPILGLNSDFTGNPKIGSIGALTAVTAHNLGYCLGRIKDGTGFHIKTWNRLYATLNGTRLPLLATNEIYFGHSTSYQTTNFRLKWNGQDEYFHGSSGLIVSTAIGSTAWYRNEGGTPFTTDLNAFGFLVRAATLKRHPSFTQGMVREGQDLCVEPGDDGYILSFDSKKHRYHIGHDDTLCIGLDTKHPVRAIKLD